MKANKLEGVKKGDFVLDLAGNNKSAFHLDYIIFSQYVKSHLYKIETGTLK